LKGVDPVLEPTVTDVGVSMREGSLEGLADRVDRETDGIVIGEDLAVQLGAFVGDTVTLLTPQGTLTPMGLMPRSRRLEVVGVFNLGLYEYDSSYGLVSVEVARRLLDKLKFDFVQVRVEDMYSAPLVADAIEAELGPGYITQDWAEMNRSLFSALWLEKTAISITIGLIVTVAAMNIIASLVLLVMEKSRDIAILKTIGASRRSVTTIFMLQGLTIGLVGTTLGAAGGYLLSRILDHYQLIRIPMDVYQVSYIPFKVEMFDFVFVVSSALLICFLATIYPSRQASRLDPAQALRNQ
jgi:lipoprotein-releasing system permease protein